MGQSAVFKFDRLLAGSSFLSGLGLALTFLAIVLIPGVNLVAAGIATIVIPALGCVTRIVTRSYEHYHHKLSYHNACTPTQHEYRNNYGGRPPLAHYSLVPPLNIPEPVPSQNSAFSKSQA